MRHKFMIGAASAALFAAMASAAAASEIVVSDSGRGWINSSGSDLPTEAGQNYLTGYCGPLVCSAPGEYRDYFSFSVPVLDGPLVGATLQIDTAEIQLEQSDALTYGVTSTSSLSFSSLGTGTLFGQETFDASEDEDMEDIVLNVDALSAITAAQGGSLTLSGRVLAPISFHGALNQYLFGNSSISLGDPSNHLVDLVLETGPANAPTPEPATWMLLVVGMGGLGVALRANRQHSALTA
jgi:hypothetical protein